MKAIWTIARRDLRSFFDHPTGYILLVVFIALNDFLFFRQAYLLGIASLRPMLDLLPWVFLFFIPAVTMRALAEESRSGTLELTLAQPLTEWELLLGKYLGQLLFILIGLALTIPIPIGLSFGADLQAGVVVAQYVGASLLAAGLTSVGIWTSSMSSNQITAFILAVAVMFVLILVGLDPLLVGLPPVLGTIAARLGVLTHFSNIARGVIDLRDAVYFLTLTAIFLVLAYHVILSRRLAPHGASRRRLRLGTGLLVAIMVVINLFGRHIGGRLDLTPTKAYTLSAASKEIYGQLDDLVTIKVFASQELPPQIALIKRDVDDLLSDVRAAGEGMVRIVERDPAEDPEAAEEARSLGIPAVQFNVVGQSELTVKEGYLGLAVQYADGSEAIPLLQRTDDLEYRLASYVRSLTRTELPAVGLLQSASQQQAGLQALRAQLTQNYDLRNVDLAADSEPLGNLDLLVAAGLPDSLPESHLTKLRDYLEAGGSMLILAAGAAPSPQGPFALPRPILWNQVLDPYGVSVRSDLVYDLAANERVAIPRQAFQVLVNYPFWLRAQSTRAMAVNQELETIFLPWASSVDTSDAPAGAITPLMVTTEAAGTEAGQILLDPSRQFPRSDLARRLLAVAINPLAADSAVDLNGRIILVGNSDFVGDRYVRSAPENMVFVQNALDWLAQDESLISIRSKSREVPRLVFTSEVTRDAIKYGNVVGVPILLVLGAIVRLIRRRRSRSRVYRPGGER